MFQYIAKHTTSKKNVYLSKQMRQRDNKVFSQFGLVV